MRVIRAWSFITSSDGILKQILDYPSFVCMAVLAACFVHKIGFIVVSSAQFFTAGAGRGNPETIIYSGNAIEVILQTGGLSNHLIPPKYSPEFDVKGNNWCLEVRFDNPTDTSIFRVKR